MKKTLTLVVAMLISSMLFLNVFADETAEKPTITVIPTYDFSREALPKSDFTAKVKTKETYKVVGLGDSIMQGVGVEDKSKTYLALATGYMQSMLPSSTLASYKNLAIDGMNTDGLLYNLQYDSYYKHTADQEYNWPVIQDVIDADQIQISIGGNDTLLMIVEKLMNELDIDLAAMAGAADESEASTAFFDQINATDLLKIKFGELMEVDETGTSPLDRAMDKFDSNLDKIVKRIRELNPDADIVIITAFNPYDVLKPLIEKFSFLENVQQLIEFLNISSTHVNETLQSFAYNIPKMQLVNITEAFNKFGLVLTSIAETDPHPNEYGHAAIYGLEVPFLSNIDLTDYTKIQKVNAIVSIFKKIFGRR